MTDKLCSISILCDLPPCNEKTIALEQFYKDANGDALVLDKWFSIQALADIDETIDNVEKLQNHSDFNYRNPNRLRSLIFSFARNSNQFHKADGSGYKLLADCVLKVDQINPQIAARACCTLINWKLFYSERQNLMKNQLTRIANTPGLSPDTLEIALKGLKDDDHNKF